MGETNPTNSMEPVNPVPSGTTASAANVPTPASSAVVPSELPTPGITSSMQARRNKKLLLIMGGVIVFLLVVVAGLLVLSTSRNNNQSGTNANEVNQDDLNSIDSNADSDNDDEGELILEGYTEYINGSYGFKLEYPEYMLLDECGIAGIHNVEAVVSICEPLNRRNDQSFDGVAVYAKNYKGSVEDFKAEQIDAWSFAAFPTTYNPNNGTVKVAGSIDALSVRDMNGFGITTLFFKHPTEDIVFGVSFTKAVDSEFDELGNILSSFTFFEAEDNNKNNNPYGASQEVRDILDEFGYVDAGFSNFEILVPEHHNWARYPDNTHGSFAGVFNVPGLIGFEIRGYYPIFTEAGGLPEDLDDFIDYHKEYVLTNFTEEHQALYTKIEKYDVENFGIAFISPEADNSYMVPGDTMNLGSSMLIFDYSGKINPRIVSVYKTYTYDDSINTADFQHNILKYMASKLTLDSN